ncbi:MAG TPA: signal recognition particle-docking protein FtsY [bacterium]|nr:signal recognition particle-docking protein FtsY [bacterium]
MRIWQWLVENFMNGELFFYVIPAVLLLILVLVIRLPDAEDRRDPDADRDKDKGKGLPPVPPERAARHDTISLLPPERSRDEPEVRVYYRDPGSAESVAVAPPTPAEDPAVAPPPEAPRNWRDGLARTRGGFFSRLRSLFEASAVTDELVEEMEEILYSADLGVATVTFLMGEVRKARGVLTTGDSVRDLLKDRIATILRTVEKPLAVPAQRPMVLLMIGVNGAGKTTTIGKLARRFIADGHRVTLAAGDTFRAAAVEQLAAWGVRTGAEVISEKEGADPAAVAFNAVNSAVAGGRDIVIVDTAGRLQNRVNLMEELRKVHRVLGKALDGAPHETILVIDANNGQNAVAQAREFGEAIPITGIIATKLDGTAKGGALVGIARELAIPVYFAGIGEAADDLRPFSADDFTEALFS